MPDIDRKFLPLAGLKHRPGCASEADVAAPTTPCSCGAEMHHALALLITDLDDQVDGVPEDVELAAPAEDFAVLLEAGTIRTARQALANQRARTP